MKKVLTWLFSIVGFFSFCYYCSKFYSHRGLEYDEKYIPMYILVFIIIITNFIIGMVNSYRLEKQGIQLEEIKEQNNNISQQNEELKQQNEDLRNLIIKVFDRLDEGQDNILNSLFNSREIPLDIYNKLRERD